MMKRVISILSLLCLMVLALPQQVRAAEDPQTGIQQLISYYRYYQQDAAREIRQILEQMETDHPEEAARWSAIMAGWRWINEEMPLNTGVLPDGLPQDDSLCIVVMGFKLENDGTMKPELVHRLETALASAEKYPNAILVCTGGATSQRSDITEAGQMKKWLMGAGIAEERILTETRAATTPQNAVFVCQMLQKNHPQISHIAIVTSDYHIYRSMTLFLAEEKLKAYGYDVSANAVCITEYAGEHELEKQARNLAEIAGVSLDGVAKPELYIADTMPTEQTEPAQTQMQQISEDTRPEATVQPQERIQETESIAEEKTATAKVPVLAVAAFAGALILALILLLILIRISRKR